MLRGVGSHTSALRQAVAVGSFRLLVVLGGAPVHAHGRGFGWTRVLISLGYIPRSGVLGPVLTLYFTF